MENSAFGKLNWKDISKGILLAVLTAVYPSVQSFLNGGAFDWQEVGKFALSAFLAYLAKNLLSSEGKFLGKI